jgi:hypothetical protein
MNWNQWMQKIKNFIYGASRVLSPCYATAAIYNHYFPDLDITVAYHTDAEEIKTYPPVTVPVIKEYEKLRVAVIGAVSREKGADILEHTACHKDPLDRLEFHLIGYAYKPLRETVVQHGAYPNHELMDRIKAVDPHVIWFPAQWPEAYCYVLSSAMLTGLPIMAPNLGSFVERLEGRPVSQIRQWDIKPEEWKNALIELREWMVEHGGESHAWENNASGKAEFRYQSDYLLPARERSVEGVEVSLADIRTLVGVSREIGQVQGRKEKILRFMLIIRELPVFRQLIKLVPFETQRKIKRLFSAKPVHDILNE